MRISVQLDPSKRPTSQQWPQYMAVFCASLTAFSMGLHSAWPSPSLPILFSDDTPLNITSEEASYVVSLTPLGNILGAPLAAALADVVGRKNAILIASIPLFVAWMFIAFAKNILTFYIGRFISGISDGFLFIVYPMYVGEVTEPHIRGVLGCLMSIMNVVGLLAINAYGPFLSIQNAAFISAVFPIISVCTFSWMPESPVFLLMKGKYEKAKQALFFLRRCDISKHLEVLQHDVERQMSEKGRFKDLLTIRSNRKAMFIVMGIRTMQQMSGISALLFFTQTIFLQADGDLSPVLSTIIYLVTQLIMTTFGSVLVDRFGRKPLLIFSCIGGGIFLNIGGIYFYLKEYTDFDTSVISWLPMLVMIGFIIIYSIGLGTVPSLMLGELFSASIKGKALFISCIFYSIVQFGVSKLFAFLSENYGMYTCFFTFGISCFVSVLFAYYFVPETKGKSLEDIQQYLKGNYDDKNNQKTVIPA